MILHLLQQPCKTIIRHHLILRAERYSNALGVLTCSTLLILLGGSVGSDTPILWMGGLRHRGALGCLELHRDADMLSPSDYTVNLHTDLSLKTIRKVRGPSGTPCQTKEVE